MENSIACQFKLTNQKSNKIVTPPVPFCVIFDLYITKIRDKSKDVRTTVADESVVLNKFAVKYIFMMPDNYESLLVPVVTLHVF